MIAFLVAVLDHARYRAVAQPALERVREADSLVLAVGDGAPPQLALNAALDELADLPDLEAVVIVHEDVELLDIDSAAIVRRAFADPDVALAGVVGAIGVRGLAWWNAEVAIGGVGSPHWPKAEVAAARATGTVDALDGLVLCLSPWAVRTLRFDEDLATDFHGYDIDLCFQARYHGRRVEVIELPVHHEHRALFTGADRWARNELRFQRQWFDHRMVTQRHHQALYPGAPVPDQAG